MNLVSDETVHDHIGKPVDDGHYPYDRKSGRLPHDKGPRRPFFAFHVSPVIFVFAKSRGCHSIGDLVHQMVMIPRDFATVFHIEVGDVRTIVDEIEMRIREVKEKK